MSFNLQNYEFSAGEHREKNVIFVHFPNNEELKKELREKFASAKWSATKKCWYLPDKNAIRNDIGLAPKTEMGKDVILSENIIHSRMNALKFYFEQVLHRDKMFFEDIPRPKKRSILPKVLDKADVSKLFSHVDNPKHALMLKLCYGMGIRVSEIVNLKITDIDSGRMLVHIEAAKGKKDRYVALPTSILEDLRDYYRAYRPKIYLFEGQYGGQYAIRSVQAVFKNAMQKAKINKTVGIHGLRHSYATHLMECGTDMSFIQKLLGHKDIKTTEIYAKVSNRQLGNIKSPLDDL